MGDQVTFASNGGSANGYLSLPSGGEKGAPGVIVIQEWWGLVGHIAAVVDRFSALGYTALAPDLYHGVSTTEPDEAGKLMMGLAMDKAAQDIAGAAAYLVAECGAPKIGTIGFCMGGSLALWSATLSDDIVATVGCYPAVPWERMSPTWSRYAGKAAMIHASEADGTTAAAGIQEAKRGIEAAGGDVTLYDYPGTEHAFFNDERPEVYAPEAASELWQRSTDFFAARLK